MTIQAPESIWDESVDLRKWIETIFRYWWLILAAMTASAAIAAVFSFLIQPVVYQSEGGIVIPASDIKSEFGFTPQGYLEFGSSTQVLDAVRRQLGLEQTAGQLRNQFSFTLENDQFLAVSAIAETAEGAFLLADAWIKSYQPEMSSLISAQFEKLRDATVEQEAVLLIQLDAAETNLERFILQDNSGHLESQLAYLGSLVTDWEEHLQSLDLPSGNGRESTLALLQTPLDQQSGSTGCGGIPKTSCMNATSQNGLGRNDKEILQAGPAYVALGTRLSRSRLSVLEQDLVASEYKLRELSFVSLPTTESKIASLEKILESESEFLGLALNDGSPIPNPVHLKVRGGLADARLLLDTQRSEEQALSQKIAALETEIDPVIESAQIEELDLEINALKSRRAVVTEEILAERATRRQLESEANQLSSQHNLAKAEKYRLTAMEVVLDSLTRQGGVREPAIPDSPISPQRGRNITLAIFLGLVAGVTASLLLDYYRGRTRVQAT